MQELMLGLRLNGSGVLASLLIASVCAYLGLFVVLKRIVFVSVSLAQISSAGIALAFLAGQYLPWCAGHPLAVSLGVTLVGVLVYSQIGRSRKVPQEATIAIGYLVASALTLMFIVRSPRGMNDVRELLDGNIITTQHSDLIALAAVFAVVAIAMALFHKQLLFVAFDAETAATQGHNPRVWELVFYVVLGTCITLAIRLAGVLAVFSYMVLPPVTGLLLARRMPGALGWAVGSAAVATLAGFCWALRAEDLPTSPPTIAVSAALMAAAWLVSKRVQPER